jgi:DNA-binding CsgD family transcriptional regulator
MPSRVSTSQRRRRRSELVRRAAGAGTATEIFAAAADALHDLVPHAAATWLGTDPVTGLPTAPSLLDGFSAPVDVCTEQWDRVLCEPSEPDASPVPALAGVQQPGTRLREAAIDPSPGASVPWFMRPQGYADELPAVLRVGDVPWGIVTLWRQEGEAAFTAAEAEVLADLSTPLADSLRRLVLTDGLDEGDAAAAGSITGVGMLMFDDRLRLVSANEHAAAWLDQLPTRELLPTRYGLRLPLWLVVTAARARESLIHGGDGFARSRVRSRRGRWVVGQASSTYDAEGAPACTAVTLDAASPAVVAPILVRAYGLTERERDITRLIARGAGTAEIAADLHLSPHTVRDHVKAVLTKVGVSSRGELVARLYCTRDEPALVAGASVLE